LAGIGGEVFLFLQASCLEKQKGWVGVMRTIYFAIIRFSSVSGVLVGLLGGVTPASAQVLPPIIDPTPGSTLTTTTVTFTGGHASQPGEQHFLSVGSGKGAFDNNIYHQSLGTGHTATVSGLPTSGTLHVLYWTSTSGAEFNYQTHTYTMAVGSNGGDGEGNHASLANDHSNLAIDHDGLDQKLDQVLAGISNIMVGAPCGQGTEGQRFVVNGPEVCDNATGLYWEQSPSTSGAFAWSSNEGPINALDRCTGLNLGNPYTYRLPEVKELISLVDYRVEEQPPVLNTPVGPFSNVQSAHYWSATTQAQDPSEAWSVNFSSGVLNSNDKGKLFYSWCVR
jgi:hypothetical protein